MPRMICNKSGDGTCGVGYEKMRVEIETRAATLRRDRDGRWGLPGEMQICEMGLVVACGLGSVAVLVDVPRGRGAQGDGRTSEERY